MCTQYEIIRFPPDLSRVQEVGRDFLFELWDLYFNVGSKLEKKGTVVGFQDVFSVFTDQNPAWLAV